MFVNNVMAGLNNLSVDDLEDGNFLDDYTQCYINDDNGHIYYGILADYYGNEVLLDLNNETFYLSNIDTDKLEEYIKMDNKTVDKFNNPEFNDLEDLREQLKQAYNEYDYDSIIEHVTNKDTVK